jgi:hypothetical protein
VLELRPGYSRNQNRLVVVSKEHRTVGCSGTDGVGQELIEKTGPNQPVESREVKNAVRHFARESRREVCVSEHIPDPLDLVAVCCTDRHGGGPGLPPIALNKICAQDTFELTSTIDH